MKGGYYERDRKYFGQYKRRRVGADICGRIGAKRADVAYLGGKRIDEPKRFADACGGR